MAFERIVGRRDVLRYGALGAASITLGAPVLAACESSDEPLGRIVDSPPPAPTGVLRVANEGEPSSLDPVLAAGSVELGIMSAIYETLLRFKDDSVELESELAESVESSSDAREWVFRLKEGIRFHDGEPLTSEAVKASFEYYAANPGLFTAWVPAAATYDDSDPLILRIISKTPFPDMARNAATLSVMSPKLISAGKEAVNKTPTGTGPFKFARYAAARDVTVEANENYRGPGPYLERIEIPIIPDASARASALRAGSVDLVRRMAPADAAALRHDDRFVVTDQLVGETAHIFLNVRDSPTSEVNVRRAMAHAIDRQAIVDGIFGGSAAEVLTSVLPPGTYGHKSPSTQYPHDLNRARRLIEDSGLPTPIRVECAWVTEVGRGKSHDRVLEAIGDMLSEIGIDLKVVSKPLAEIAKTLTPGYQRSYQGVIFDLENGMNAGPIGFTTKIFDNVTGMRDDSRFQELQDRMLSTPDGPQRLQVFGEMQEYFNRELPAIQLYDKAAIDAHTVSVVGYQTPRDGIRPDYRKVYLSG